MSPLSKQKIGTLIIMHCKTIFLNKIYLFKCERKHINHTGLNVRHVLAYFIFCFL